MNTQETGLTTMPSTMKKRRVNRDKRTNVTLELLNIFTIRAFIWLIPLIGLALLSPVAHAQSADQSADNNSGMVIVDEEAEPAEIVTQEQESAASDKLQRTMYFGLGGGVSNLDPDTDKVPGVEVSDGEQAAAQLTLGMDVNKWLSVEFHGTELGEVELSDDTSIAYSEYGFSGLVYLGGARDRKNRHGWTVFGRAGVGHLSNDSNDAVYKQNEEIHMVLGAGTEFSTRSGLALRAEALAFDTDASYLQLGLIYRIGRSTNWFSTPLTAEALKDRMSRMSGKGNREPTPDDHDGDGVLKRDDKCPDTPGTVAVGKNGCALFNGVVDGLTFLSGSAELTDSAREVLDSVAASLRQIPGARARVSAHTDNYGDSDVNMKLSQDRAFSVARYLVGQGITKDRLEARAFGETRPIDTNSTVAGRRYNRRVEIDLIAE